MSYAEALFGPSQRVHLVVELPAIRIGLSLARCVLRRYRDEIWAVVTPEAGATLWLTLPQDAPHRPSTESQVT
jgi:light-regulated signal transduction histidine kinase (bacteriophytochrome)